MKQSKYRPFNLEEAKKGAPLITRDGKKARLLGTINNPHHPLVIAYTIDTGLESWITTYENGSVYYRTESANDIFMAPIKRIGYQILYKGVYRYYTGGTIYDSKEEAKEHIMNYTKYVSVIEIEYDA